MKTEKPEVHKIGKKARAKAKKVLKENGGCLCEYLLHHSDLLDNEHELQKVAAYWRVWRVDIQCFVDEVKKEIANPGCRRAPAPFYTDFAGMEASEQMAEVEVCGILP